MPLVFAPLVALLLAGAPAPADTAVVCPKPYRAALEPWLRYRAAQGHNIAIVDADGSPEEVRNRLIGLAAGGGLSFVLLVGHAASRKLRSRAPAWPPSLYRRGECPVGFGEGDRH